MTRSTTIMFGLSIGLLIAGLLNAVIILKISQERMTKEINTLNEMVRVLNQEKAGEAGPGKDGPTCIFPKRPKTTTLPIGGDTIMDEDRPEESILPMDDSQRRPPENIPFAR